MKSGAAVKMERIQGRYTLAMAKDSLVDLAQGVAERKGTLSSHIFIFLAGMSMAAVIGNQLDLPSRVSKLEVLVRHVVEDVCQMRANLESISAIECIRRVP